MDALPVNRRIMIDNGRDFLSLLLLLFTMCFLQTFHFGLSPIAIARSFSDYRLGYWRFMAKGGANKKPLLFTLRVRATVAKGWSDWYWENVSFPDQREDGGKKDRLDLTDGEQSCVFENRTRLVFSARSGWRVFSICRWE